MPSVELIYTASTVYNPNIDRHAEQPTPLPLCLSPSLDQWPIALIPPCLLIASHLPILNNSTQECHNHASINQLRPPLSDDPAGASSSTPLGAVPRTGRTARIVCMRGSCRFGDIDDLALARSDCSLFNNDRRVRATAETHSPLRWMLNDAFNVDN